MCKKVYNILRMIILHIKGDVFVQNIGISGLLIILVLALIIFGPKKLPEIGRAFGQTLREFKKSARELSSDMEDEEPKKKLN